VQTSALPLPFHPIPLFSPRRSSLKQPAAMPEPETSIDYVMEKASGPHFSGLHLDGLLSPSSSPRASSSSAAANTTLPRQPFVIGVSGGTASGKTTVCDMIIQQLHDHRVVLVNQDSFYRGLNAEELERVQEYNFDHPDAFDTEQLLKCMEKLGNGQSVQVPIYDFKTHQRRTDTFRQVNASDVIILEGILIFHDQRVRNLMNMKIFVDTDPDVRLARRLRRDIVERGRDINSVLEQARSFNSLMVLSYVVGCIHILLSECIVNVEHKGIC